MDAIVWLFDTVIYIYTCLLIASAILSWLIAFNVVNTRHPLVGQIAEFLYRITEPPLRPIRRILPNFGGIDISPIVLVIMLQFLSKLLHSVLGVPY